MIILPVKNISKKNRFGWTTGQAGWYGLWAMAKVQPTTRTIPSHSGKIVISYTILVSTLPDLHATIDIETGGDFVYGTHGWYIIWMGEIENSLGLEVWR